MAKLIFGCGYFGLRVARLWREQGNEVWAVTRSAERGEQLASEGIRPIVGDMVAGTQLPLPQGVLTILYGVGYDRSKGMSIRDVFAGGLAQALRMAPKTVERVVYVSSTGVYGQVMGEEVDEYSPCKPMREGGLACLAAEQVLRDSAFGQKSIILRLAGLYGPGRIPRARELAAGQPIDAPATGWLNLIHVEDAARIVLAAEAKAPLPRSYVVSDGQPVQRAQYYAELARLLRAPPPRFVDAPVNTPATDRAASDKRVNPRRMFAELAPRLAYPSYREGLAAIVAQESELPGG